MLKQKIFFCSFFILCLLTTSSALAKDDGNRYTPAYTQMNGAEILEMLKKNNLSFQKNPHNQADISAMRRQATAKGQHPYAVVVACSDSRTPPEHIFNAGLGELFVIRNAGNIIHTNELGSIEYAVEHLNVKLIIVMGHTKCGAIGAAIAHTPNSKKSKTQLQKVVQHVYGNLQGEKDPRDAEKINVQNSLDSIANDEIIQKYIKNGSVLLRGALYDVHSGAVEFF